jgi:hypothetical protein
MDNNKNVIIKYKKRLIIKRNTNNDDLLLVKEFFEDPNKYLKKNENFVIGDINLNKSEKLLKKTNSLDYVHSNGNTKAEAYTQTNYKNLTKIELYLPINKKEKKINRKLCKYNFLSSNNQILSNIRNYSEQNSNKSGIHYKQKSLNDILDILKTSKSREEKNKYRSTNDLIPKKAKKEIRNKFYKQEKILKKVNEQPDLMSKLLASKVKRKEEDLLYNKIEDFRLKKKYNRLFR